MKKRILAALVMSALVLSMAGCGGKSESGSSPADDTSGESISVSTENATLATEPTAADSSPADIATAEQSEAEEPKIEKYITDNDVQLKDGYLTFAQDDTGYVYDIANKKMYDYDIKTLGENPVVRGKLAIGECGAYNLETKEVIASTYNDHLYSGSKVYIATDRRYDDPVDPYIPIVKVDSTPSGNTFSAGVINTNCEWVVPLSADNELSKIITDIERIYFNSDSGITYMVPGPGRGNPFYFDLLSDKNLGEDYYDKHLDEAGRNKVWGAFDSERALMGNITDWPSIKDVVMYNIKTGESVDYGEGVTYDLFQSLPNNKGYWWTTNEYDHHLMFDNDGYKLDFNIDYSKYKISKIYDVTDKYVAFNSNGFLVVLGKDGNEVIPAEEATDGIITICGDIVVNRKRVSSGEDFTIDLKTGEKKTFAETDFKKVDSVSGMILVKNDNGYFLADPADPETLINPFA